MKRDSNCDLQACLSIQPRRSYAVPARKTQELASLLSLVDDDSARAITLRVPYGSLLSEK